mmetsp:Transcript_8391/g.30948  ORF Transcript_8391/g.30948 Transcript_8391/m.30948 type:complete len:200 (-) Transcript_8391:848-1447(-)
MDHPWYGCIYYCGHGSRGKSRSGAREGLRIGDRPGAVQAGAGRECGDWRGRMDVQGQHPYYLLQRSCSLGRGRTSNDSSCGDSGYPLVQGVGGATHWYQRCQIRLPSVLLGDGAIASHRAVLQVLPCNLCGLRLVGSACVLRGTDGPVQPSCHETCWCLQTISSAGGLEDETGLSVPLSTTHSTHACARFISHSSEEIQ